jgi:hypothetical protein|tara:strand:+ start:321 stop:665 length:345 start_codon:yes stop_codon:yes gene_type:complete
MSVYVKNLTVNTHVDFSENLELLQINGTPTDITGFTLESQVRKHPDSSTAYNFTVGITSSTEGKITLSMDDTITSSIKPGRYLYDVMITKTNNEKLIAVEGQVLVRSGVTTGCP